MTSAIPGSVGVWCSRYRILLSLLMLCASFVGLALAVQNDPTSLDRWMSATLGTIVEQEGAGAAFWEDVTVLGGGPVIALVVALSTGYLFLARHQRSALAILVFVAAASASIFLLKGWFQRARPQDINALIAWDQFSFPSGHSTISSMVYPTLFALTSRFVEGRRLKAYCLFCGLLLMVLIGVSRVVLRVHFATDILAGWAVGLSWALVSSVVVSRLQRSGLVEPEPVASEAETEEPDRANCDDLSHKTPRSAASDVAIDHGSPAQ